MEELIDLIAERLYSFEMGYDETENIRWRQLSDEEQEIYRSRALCAIEVLEEQGLLKELK